MSVGCEGCLVSGKGQQQEYQTVKQEAINYAKEQQQTVVLYKEGYEYRYCTEPVARENGYPIMEYISQH